MAADKSDQPGVLGNLPRSRPGQRSEKRAAAATTPKRKPAPARKRAPAARKPAGAPPRRERAVPEPTPGSPDPLTAAFRTAGKVAEFGLKTASGILRRLPGR